MNNELHFLYDSLISVLRKEIEVYSKLHKCFLNEREILSGSSVDELYESNSRKETCILKARMVEEARTKLIERIINALNLDGKVLSSGDRTLSALLFYGDVGQKRNMEECRSALRSLLRDIHTLNDRNKTLLDSSLFYVRKSIDFLGQIVYSSATYLNTGRLKANNLNGKILSREG
ncbi:MAG: flagellar protein FlgN [Thermodesulfobacteriota bacterium]|nr:flagellar protein FlgN [Thermodesulfobacteriota bacterium]